MIKKNNKGPVLNFRVINELNRIYRYSVTV